MVRLAASVAGRSPFAGGLHAASLGARPNGCVGRLAVLLASHQPHQTMMGTRMPPAVETIEKLTSQSDEVPTPDEHWGWSLIE